MTTAYTARPQDLLTHPLADLIPLPPVSDPASRAILASICDLGRVTDALKVCKGRVVDGRMRLRAAIAAGLEEVPITEVAESEVATIAMDSLVARKHLTKSALAYVSIPLTEQRLAESRDRRTANLRSTGAKTGVAKISMGTRVEEIAESLGISRRTYFAARDLRKKLEANAQARAELEPKILSGEMSLEQAQQSLAGKLAALSGKTTPKGDPNQLMLELFESAEVRLTRWDKLTAKQRTEAKDKFREQILCNLPDELIEETELYLRERKASRSSALRA